MTPTSPQLLALPDGRTLAYDDVGDPAGRPVVYFHGTPDCRLARHPDDGLAAGLGIRLIAVDRPGCGQSSPHPDGTMASFAADVADLVDALGIDSLAAFGWSGGAPHAFAAAGHSRLQGRVTAVAIAAGLVPFDAFADPALHDAVHESRGWFLEAAGEMAPTDLAVEVAPMLVPYPLSIEMALEHVREVAGPTRRREFDEVPGSEEQLAQALVETVAHGLEGVELDVRLQATPHQVDLTTVTAPVHLWYGEADHVCPPAMGEWYRRALASTDATLTVVPGAGHAVTLTHWSRILQAI